MPAPRLNTRIASGSDLSFVGWTYAGPPFGLLADLALVAHATFVLFVLGGGLGHPGGVPWLPIGVAAVLGLVLTGIASIYPARAAARVSIVEALHFD